MAGFYCPNASTIIPCPSGSYCPEGSVKPLYCENLSVCSDRANYELNFINILIAILASLCVTYLAVRQNYRQRKAESRSRGQVPGSSNDNTTTTTIVVPSSSSSPSPSVVPLSLPVGLSFEFQDIDVNVPGHPHPYHTHEKPSVPHTVRILSQVNGRIIPGSFSALMGPTACGKSTLLNILRSGGKLASHGQLKVSAHYRNIHDSSSSSSVQTTLISDSKELSRRIGFVPQEDILDRSLTVRELFTFNARARQPFDTSIEHINEIVYNTLADLGLLGCADTVIGGGPNSAANISGGQLKRVNIGCELVSLQRPAALLMDEPTSGLDASIANEVCETLAKLTNQGITVLMIVQQPRPEIFQRFQHILFMQHGRIVYEGPSEGAAPYFTKLGFSQPDDASDADFCIDVLTGIVSRKRTKDATDDGRDSLVRTNMERKNIPKRYALAEAWSVYSPSDSVLKGDTVDNLPSASAVNPLWQIKKNNATGALNSTGVSSTHEGNTLIAATPPLAAAQRSDEIRSFLYLVYLNAQRALVSRFRNTRNLLIYGGLHVIMAVSLSVGFTVFIQQTYRNTLDIPVREALVSFCPSVLKDYCSNRNQLDLGFAQLLFFISTAVGCASALSAIPLFGGQIELVQREQSSGLSSIAYSFGRMVSDSVIVFFNGLIFAGVWLLFGHSGPYYAWLGVILPTAFASAGIGYTAAVLTRPTNAAVIAIIVITAFCVFSGVEPTLTSVKGYHILNWVWYLSFSTYSAEGVYYTWVQYFRPNTDAWSRVIKGADYFGYSIESQSRSIGALFAIGFMWRIITIVILYIKTKPKQYGKQ